MEYRMRSSLRTAGETVRCINNRRRVVLGHEYLRKARFML